VFIAKMPRNPHPQNETIESGVGYQQVAAAAQHKQRHSALNSPGSCLGNLRFACGLDKPARGTANAKGGEWREQFVFFEKHQDKATSRG
jgi:hypothetical protein